MPRSMTGFGAAHVDTSAGSATIEIRTVNHRHLDVRWHGFADHPELVVEAERDLKAVLQRGRVDVRFHSEPHRPHRVGDLDEEAVRRRVAQVKRLAEELGLDDDLRASSLLGLGTAFVAGEELVGVSESDRNEMRRGFGEALQQVVRMRNTEGSRTTSDLQSRLAGFSRLLEEAGRRRQGGAERRMVKLRERVEELLQGQRLEDERILQELAVLADRTDVTEELERARGHVAHFEAQLDACEPVGRKLDFIVQELGREVNTMGSKAHELSEVVVELKSELEKLREQIQNLE
ncbi:MAG: YicC/YloC family endoribonuclease [Myxococcota bacterium]